MDKKDKKSLGKQIFRTLLFLAIGVFILYLVYRQQNAAFQAQCVIDGVAPGDCNFMEKIWTDLKTVNLFWISAVILAFLMSMVSRALRWIMLIKPMGYKPGFLNSIFAIMVGNLANLALPRMGEIVKIGTLSRYEKIPFEKVTGTIVVDRVMDVICLFLMVCLALIGDYDLLWGQISTALSERDNSSNTQWIWAITAIVFLVILSLWTFKAKIKRLSLYEKVRSKVTGFLDGIKTIGKLDSPLLFIVHSLIIWIMFYLMTYLAFYSFAPTEHLSMKAGLTVFIFGSLGIVIPSPGGMGTFHYLTILALSLYGISAADGFSFANIVFFSVQLFSNIVYGIIALVCLPLLNKQKSVDTIENTVEYEKHGKHLS